METKQTICLIGLGYVGLPLAHAFAKKGYSVSGFDISEKRISELKAGHDRTNELTDAQLKEVSIEYSTDPSIIKNAEVVIVTVPTPVDENNKPDLSPVESASHIVGKNLRKDAIVVYESTVYPGVTEDLCGPILEKESGMKCGTDFTLGYSPERINPGDKKHTVEHIVKIVAGQDEKTLNILADLYGSIITAGVHRAPSIKVAEMAKAIENAQRDLNIAYINEIAMLCNHIGRGCWLWTAASGAPTRITSRPKACMRCRGVISPTRGRPACPSAQNGTSFPSPPASSAATASALIHTISLRKRSNSG